MFTLRKSQKTAVAVLMSLGVTSAHAVLERQGPVDPSNGFPAWMQDTSGLALEFCSPLNAAELAAGWCLLTAANTVAPETFPSAFADEHFWWASTATAGPALLVLAVEAAFANGPVKAGDQIAFSRIRVKLNNVPVTGTYRFIHPYGEEVIQGTAGDRIFFTDDVGINCGPGQFQCALDSRLGPYLLPSATPGGAELAPIAGPVAGKLYIADPARLGPVTGSPTGNNKFRVEGPAGSNLGGPGIDFVETTDFTLMGRIFTGTIPAQTTIDQASYARSAASQKVEVYATAKPSRAGRLPASPVPPATPPDVTVFDVPCGSQVLNPGTASETTVLVAPVGGTSQVMAAAGDQRYALMTPAVIPNSVCYGDSVTGLFADAAVNDEVTITDALYDPAAKTLGIVASSSDSVAPPTLTLDGFTATPVTGTGSFVVANVTAPPANVRVDSSARGFDVEQVVTGVVAGTVPGAGGAGAPVAVADALATTEDTASAAINLLANDTNAVGGTLALVGLPAKGSFNAATGVYTPNANANGADSFSYQVTTAGGTSNTATVAVTIAAVNDAPVANADGATTNAGTPVAIPVLANDTDVDGDALTVSAVTPPTSGTASINADNTVSYSPNAGFSGSDSFGYTVSDGNGGSATATVAVTVTAAAPPPAPAPSLTVLAPNGGETFRVKSNLAISWSSTLISRNQRINVSYSANGGATWRLILGNRSNTGSATWNVPLNAVSTQGLIKVCDARTGAVCDASNGTFTVTR